MKTLRPSPFSTEQIWLRDYLIKRRKELGLSQRALAEKLGVIYSFVAKVETGDRRLELVSFIHYCRGLDLCPFETLKLLEGQIERR
ncbi:MAG: helix-turn-helix domain-containing protein [Gammaproteobacteria bacterium]|nr:helix-turn-helix domain-containing protein [Gammaproteobacteria bacterium]